MLSTAFAQALLDHYFLNSDHANVGDAAGLQNSAAAGSLYISGHTAYPGLAGAQNTSEAAYTSYARVAVARSAAGWTRSGRNMSNTAEIRFPTPTGGSETWLYAAMGSDSSGAGNLFSIMPLGSILGGFAALAGTDTIYLPNHGLAVDDRVAFFATQAGAALPTGITEGTVYFVKTAPDTDTITISATSGGATIDITADGAGLAWKIVPLSITSSPAITPVFAAGQLDFYF